MKTRYFLLAVILFFAAPSLAKETSYKLSGPYVHHNLQIFLIHGPEQIKAHKYVTLTEAMEKKLVVVHETGQVSQLAIENKSKDVAVFIHSGDIVKGGRQDRVLSFDVIIPPSSGKVPLASFCVESGRWAPRGKEASAAEQQKLSYNLQRMTGKSDLDVRSGKSASSMQLTLENKELKQTAEEYNKKLSGIIDGKNDVVGFAFVINDEVNNADVYGTSYLFKALWPKLLKSAVVEAIAEFKSPDAPTPAQRLQTISHIAVMFAEAMKGKPETQDPNKRTRLITKETKEHLLFETRDQKVAGKWLHRNFIKKPPAPPPAPKNRRDPANVLNNDDLPQQQRPINPPPQMQQRR
jgi:hypothetical protein